MKRNQTVANFNTNHNKTITSSKSMRTLTNESKNEKHKKVKPITPSHGKTLQKARTALEEKIYDNLDVDEAIKEFRKKFNNTDKYRGTEFYTWHRILTKSCEMGRDNFVKNHNIDLENEFTVKEFIKICENDFGGKIIKQLKEFYK